MSLTAHGLRYLKIIRSLTFELRFQHFHVFANFPIQDLSIVLCRFEVPMPQHFTDRLDWHPITQSDRRRKSMPGDMKGQILPYPADIGNFLQVGVHLLIAQHRKHMIGIATSRVVPVFFNNRLGGRK